MCRFVLFVITGSVMMNRISNTSMTSTSGVVFMSAMGPESSFAPMLMAMRLLLVARTPQGSDWPESGQFRTRLRSRQNHGSTRSFSGNGHSPRRAARASCSM
jgi:hypothetical protein